MRRLPTLKFIDGKEVTPEASVTSLSPSRTSTDPHLSKSTDRHLACNIAVLLPEMRTVVRWKALKHTFQMSTGFRCVRLSVQKLQPLRVLSRVNLLVRLCLDCGTQEAVTAALRA